MYFAILQHWRFLYKMFGCKLKWRFVNLEGALRWEEGDKAHHIHTYVTILLHSISSLFNIFSSQAQDSSFYILYLGYMNCSLWTSSFSASHSSFHKVYALFSILIFWFIVSLKLKRQNEGMKWAKVENIHISIMHHNILLSTAYCIHTVNFSLCYVCMEKKRGRVSEACCDDTINHCQTSPTYYINTKQQTIHFFSASLLVVSFCRKRQVA